MAHKKFGPNDIFINRVKMHPEWDFFIYNSEVYINNSQNISGSLAGGDSYKNVPNGYLSLYEYNLNRTGKFIYPFVIKQGHRIRFRNETKNLTGERKSATDTWGSLTAGAEITSSYKMSASITREFLTSGAIKTGVIKNTCRRYQTINPSFSDSLVDNLTTTPLYDIFTASVNMINIPSIFYGSSIKKGTVDLNYYVTGTLVATAKDENQNGQIYCTFGTASVSGSLVGHVLYDEGIIFFPKTYAATVAPLADIPIKHGGGLSFAVSSSWQFFGAGAADGITHDVTHASASYSINFEGTTYKNSMTMFCHVNKGEFNYSNNPTFKNIEQSSSIIGFTTSSYSYSDRETDIKNIASSSFHKGEDEFRKVTYISKVGVYDEENNLLMTVDLARPYKKEEDDDLTFKIKYDLL